MQELIERLRSYLPLGLECHWSQASKNYVIAFDLIESQAAEIAELDALRNDAVLRLDTYKALVAEAIDKSGSCIICGFSSELEAAIARDDYVKSNNLEGFTINIKPHGEK